VNTKYIQPFEKGEKREKGKKGTKRER